MKFVRTDEHRGKYDIHGIKFQGVVWTDGRDVHRDAGNPNAKDVWFSFQISFVSKSDSWGSKWYRSVDLLYNGEEYLFFCLKDKGRDGKPRARIMPAFQDGSGNIKLILDDKKVLDNILEKVFE